MTLLLGRSGVTGPFPRQGCRVFESGVVERVGPVPAPRPAIELEEPWLGLWCTGISGQVEDDDAFDHAEVFDIPGNQACFVLLSSAGNDSIDRC